MVCSADDKVLAFHLGELAEVQIVSVGEHLSVCSRCDAKARRLDACNDAILSALLRSDEFGLDLRAAWARERYPVLPAPTDLAPAIPNCLNRRVRQTVRRQSRESTHGAGGI